MKKKLSNEQKKGIRTWRKVQVFLFSGVLITCAVIGLLLPFRPKVSEAEKRRLTEFPSPTVKTFLDGSFFSEVSLWYSDTYPMRDSLIRADHNFKHLYGFEPSIQMYGGNETADTIPNIPEPTTESVITATISDTLPAATEHKEPQLPNSMEMEAEIQNQIQNGVYVEDGSAYSMYYFNQEAADSYIQSLEYVASVLAGKTNVYSILIPNQSGVMLPEETRRKLGGSDQQQAIDYYYASYSNVKSVPTIETLREHNDEYLYFRTDHHWTQLAAYYTYQNFCDVKGITCEQLSDYKTTKTFDNFLGSFYASYGNSDMEKHPDSITAYYPNATNSMKFWNINNEMFDWYVISDVEGWDAGTLYNCFIGGDNPLSIIENPAISDGSSCLVLKESYGNCFVPFLVDHYQTVYVVDFRYAQQNVLQYVQEKEIDDLIVINNITIIGSSDVAETIGKLLR